MNRHQLEPLQSWRIAAALTITLMLFHGAASAATTTCGTSISACGCTITTSGTYTLTADLSSTQGLTATGDCIDIKASNVILNTDEFSITGPGSGTSTGAGIDVLKGASGAFIGSGGLFVDGSSLEDWKYGLQVQGKNTISNGGTYNDNVMGVFLDGATGATISNLKAEDNTVYGVWVRGGKDNQINDADTEDNTTGLYIGCHDDDTRGTTCKGVKPSSGNRVYNSGSTNNGDAGVVVDLGDEGNVLIDTEVLDNLGGTDSIDENPGCGTNDWLLNGQAVFGVTTQSCIP